MNLDEDWKMAPKGKAGAQLIEVVLTGVVASGRAQVYLSSDTSKAKDEKLKL